MPNDSDRALKATAVFIAVALLSGCAQTKSWLDKVTPGAAQSSSGTVILGAPSADDYLQTLDLLATGDPATQAEIYADAESRSTLTPDPSTNLRFALVLATPGHSESDPEQAQSMLRELLTQTALMTSYEIALAEIHLNAVEDRIVLGSEARRLRQASSRQAQTEEQALRQRLAAVEAENRTLRRGLDEAQEKLAAITNIERSIRNQEQ
ncbi:MAG: hypothetical protein IIC62_06555 [Proteobacteria bacterium]|nr:hypothetical protein [Pseudomonadota bacterium]